MKGNPLLLAAAVSLSLCLFARTQTLISQTKCFKVVTHYYTNPKVTRNTSVVLYTYRDNEQRNVTFFLSCNSAGEKFIQVEKVLLLLPLTERGYCLDSKSTNYENCSSKSNCDCCQLPDKVCGESSKQDLSVCSGAQECYLNISSRFLHNCSGIEYSCNDRRCHSRWAQVVYKCKSRENLAQVGEILNELVLHFLLIWHQLTR